MGDVIVPRIAEIFHVTLQQLRSRRNMSQSIIIRRLDRESLPKVRMPNRDGYIPDAVFKVDDERQAPRKRAIAP